MQMVSVLVNQGMEHVDFTSKYLTGAGVEIGAFLTPIPGIKPTYVDRFETYADQRTLADYYGDATDLPFLNDSLNYVASSHVIEHVANPLAALVEWVRVLRHGGYVYMVVPDRRHTFDRKRELTHPAHMMADFRSGISQCDGAHIDDFVFGVDWSLFSPDTPAAEIPAAQEKLAYIYRWSIGAGKEINIHFHTFEPQSMASLIKLGNRANLWEGKLKICELIENFPRSNPIGFLLVARVAKSWRHRIGCWSRPTGLRPDARRFAAPTPPLQTGSPVA